MRFTKNEKTIIAKALENQYNKQKEAYLNIAKYFPPESVKKLRENLEDMQKLMKKLN